MSKSKLLLSFLLLTGIIISCGNETEEPKTVITVTTTQVTQINPNSAKSGGDINITGNATIDGKGVCWSTSSNPAVSLSTKTADGIGSSSYTSNLTGLAPSTTYYVRAYATYSEGIVYGNELTFTTGAVVLPTVTTSSITNITQTTATVGGNVTSDGGATVTERGVCYSTTQNPTVDNSKVQIGSGTGTFTSNITGLTANTTYYVRAYATNSAGTSYGEQVLFTTLNYVAPSVSDVTANTNNKLNTVTFSGKVNANGFATTSIKFEYGISSYDKSVSLNNVSGNSFTSVSVTIDDLIPNTTYKYRLVVVNIGGTTSSNELSFLSLNYAIGVEYLGGIIASLDGTGTHGVIVSKNDLTSSKWSNSNESVSTNASTGDTNTSNIINTTGSGDCAAKKCRDLGDDWYLPSRNELYLLYDKKTDLNITGSFYWSSTQSTDDTTKGVAVDFSLSNPTPTPDDKSKFTVYSVRAIRKF